MSDQWLSIAVASVLAQLTFGCLTWPLARGLWYLWTIDPLRSIGILIPPASIALCVRAWRGTHLGSDGSWWGLPIVCIAVLGGRFVRLSTVGVGFRPGVVVAVLSVGVLLWIYMSGVVLLFAGTTSYRKVMFPIALLLLVNPVPSLVTTLLDLRLQIFAARAARMFAIWLGMRLQGNQLQILFPSGNGMSIVPGCDGLRGAVAMGVLTLVLGYLRGMPRWVHALYVAGGVLLAYLLNLVRLCALVLCYRIAMNIPGLLSHILAADYVIGAVLFCGAVGLLTVPLRISEST